MTLLLLLLISLFIFTGFLFKWDIFSPSILYSASFVFAGIVAWLNRYEWDMVSINSTTTMVICGSVILFILVAKSTQQFCNNFTLTKTVEKTTIVNDGILMIILIIEIINVFIIIFTLRKLTGLSNFLEAANYITTTHMPGYVGDIIFFPKYVSFLIQVNTACTLVIGYFLIRSILVEKNKKSIFIKYIIILVGLFTPLLGGNRGNDIYILLALLTYSYYMFMSVHNWKYRYNIKYGIWLLIMTSLIIILLPLSAVFLQRNLNGTANDYIAGYIGGSLKNLDSFISSGMFPIKEDFFGRHTFLNMGQPVAKLLGLTIDSIQDWLPFRYVNGHGTGNVYTIFYPWLLDFGYFGVFWLTSLMSILSQVVYNFAVKSDYLKTPYYMYIIYGYISAYLILSFFSNRFFEGISLDFIYLTISIMVLLILIKRTSPSN